MRVETLADLPQDPIEAQAVPHDHRRSSSAGLVAGQSWAAFAAQISSPRLRREEQLRRREPPADPGAEPKGGSRRDKGPRSPQPVPAAGAEAYRTLRATISRVHAPEEAKAGPGDPRRRPVRQRGQEHDGPSYCGLVACADRTGAWSLIKADAPAGLRCHPSSKSEPSSGGIVGMLLIERDRLCAGARHQPDLRTAPGILLADQSGAGQVTDLFSHSGRGR